MPANGNYDDSPFVAELYDHVKLYRERGDIPFWVGAALDAGGPVLELGCGTGRTLIPMAQAGVQVVGIDSSPHMLRVCRDRLEGLDEEVRSRVELKQLDIRDMNLSAVFRLVAAPFRVFQFLLTVEDQIACLRSVHESLRQGATFIVDLSFPALSLFSTDDLGAEISYEPEVELPDGRRVLRRHRYIRKDRFAQTIDFHAIYIVTHLDGRTERLIQRFSLRYLYRYEAEHLLHRCGFEVRNVWAGHDKSAFGARDPSDLIIEARKR
jgi:SAM-dependent methyltransferase